MNVQAVQRGVVDAGDAVGNDEVAQDPVDVRPDERRHQIPQAHVDAGLLPPGYGDQELHRDAQKRHPQQDVDQQRELGGFEALVVAHGEGNKAGRQRQVP